MAIRKQSAVKHISWEELTDMCNSIAGQLRFGKPIKEITAVDERSVIPANIIAYKLGCKVGNNGTTFGITSDRRPDACFFYMERENEFMISDTKSKIETIPVDIEGEYQRFTMPWEK